MKVLPVIWQGACPVLAHLTPENASLISSSEIPLSVSGAGDQAILFRDANWWEPDEEEAIRFIRQAIEGWNAPMIPANKRILESFTWEKATRRLIEILCEAESISEIARKINPH